MHKYLKKTIEYASGSFLNKLVLFLLLPIFTKFLLPEEYAVYSNVTIFVSFASLVYTLGFQQSLFSYFYEKKSKEYQYTLISTIFITLFIVDFILSLLLILFNNQFSLLLLRTERYAKLFYYVSIIIFFDVQYSMTLSIFNIMEKSRHFIIFASIKTVILAILILYGWIQRNLNIELVFTYIAVASTISALISLIYLRNFHKKMIKRADKKPLLSFPLQIRLLKFGLVMIPGTIAMMSMKMLDRYMITYLSAKSVETALHNAGIYALGYKIGMLMNFLVSLISLVYFPYAMRISDRLEAKKIYKKMFTYYSIFGGLLGGLIIFFSSDIFLLFLNQNYYDSIKIVQFGVISVYLVGIFNLLNIGFYIKKKAKNIALAFMIGAFVNIILNFLLIPHYGIYGAGLASILAYFIIVIYEYWIVEKFYKVGYEIIYSIFMIIILFLIGIFSNMLPLNSNLFWLKLIILIISLILLILYYRKNEKLQELITNIIRVKK